MINKSAILSASSHKFMSFQLQGEILNKLKSLRFLLAEFTLNVVNALLEMTALQFLKASKTSVA
jgi:hypothetical protein